MVVHYEVLYLAGLKFRIGEDDFFAQIVRTSPSETRRASGSRDVPVTDAMTYRASR